MALMEFREPNQAKWQGSRPGHNGVQVFEGIHTIALGWVLIYTVPVGQTLYLTHAAINGAFNGSATLYLGVYDTTPVIVQYLFGAYKQMNFSSSFCNANYWPPIEIPAGYTIQAAQSGNIGMTVTLHGWAE